MDLERPREKEGERDWAREPCEVEVVEAVSAKSDVESIACCCNLARRRSWISRCSSAVSLSSAAYGEVIDDIPVAGAEDREDVEDDDEVASFLICCDGRLTLVSSSVCAAATLGRLETDILC